jgi:hypothetical protein
MAEILLKPEEVEAFYKRVAEITASGTEEDVRTYINDHYPFLPEEDQTRILFSLMRSSIDQSIEEERVIDQIQTEGLAAAEVLENMKTEAEAAIKRGEEISASES